MKIIQKNIHNFNHDKVNEKYGPGLTYLNNFPEKKEDGDTIVWSVYHAANPDRSKNHKNFVLLGNLRNGNFIITGRDDLESIRFVNGIKCEVCDTVIYSAYRHDFTECGCDNQASIDGGLDYMRVGAMDMDKIKNVRIDLLLNEVLEAPEEDLDKK